MGVCINVYFDDCWFVLSGQVAPLPCPIHPRYYARHVATYTTRAPPLLLRASKVYATSYFPHLLKVISSKNELSNRIGDARRGRYEIQEVNDRTFDIGWNGHKQFVHGRGFKAPLLLCEFRPARDAALITER